MPSKELKRLKVAAMVAPLSLAVGMVLAPQVSAGEKAYVESSSKNVVMDSYGNCVTSSGMKVPMEKCGDIIAKEEPPPAPMVDADSDGDGVPDSRDKCPGTRAGAKVDANGCEIIESITINLDVEEFGFDSAKLTPAMETALADVADRINASKGDESLDIIGHTDSTGPADYNQKLSERRAQSVADFLAARGVDSGRMNVSGMGETSPIADNSTREGRSRNRRVEIQTQ